MIEIGVGSNIQDNAYTIHQLNPYFCTLHIYTQCQQKPSPYIKLWHPDLLPCLHMHTGDVVLKEHSSVFYNCTLRGDINLIEIGVGSNIQDNTCIHNSSTEPTIVGDYVTVGEFQKASL